MDYTFTDLRKVCLVGVDTITSAFALSIKRAGYSRIIYGVDEPSQVKYALACGSATEGGQSYQVGLRGSNLIVLSRICREPAERLANILEAADPHSIVLDSSAVKGHEEAVFEASGRKNVHYVGFHIVQDQLRDPSELNPSQFFFDSKAVILSPRNRKDYPAYKMIAKILESSGAKAIAMSPQDFRKRIATLEFMPDMLDFLALEAVMQGSPEEKIPVDYLGERLIKRLKRFAGLNGSSWCEAVAGTQDHLDELLELIEASLKSLRQDIHHGKLKERVNAVLEQGEYVQQEDTSTSDRELIVITGGVTSVKQKIAMALVGARISLGNLEELRGKTNGAYKLRLDNVAERDRATEALRAAGIEVELTD